MHGLVALEQLGLFKPKLGSFIRGTVQCAIADNLGAYGLAGFVEDFSVKYYCHFCTAKENEIQDKDVKSAAFQRGAKNAHQSNVKKAKKKKKKGES